VIGSRPDDVPVVPSPPIVADIHQRDDRQFQIGLDAESALGPFESRNFAEQVRLRRTRHQDNWLRQ
jgi:hypothetical protein